MFRFTCQQNEGKKVIKKTFILWFIKLNVGLFWNRFNLVFCLLVQDIPGIVNGKTNDRGCSGISIVWVFILGLPVTQNIITKVFLSCYLYSDPGSLNCGLKFGPFEIFGGKVSLDLFTQVSNEIPRGMDIGLIVCLQDVLWDLLFLCCHLQQFLRFLSQAYRRPTKSRGVASY